MRIAVLSFILTSPLVCAISGCASSSASGAHTDSARILTLDEYRQASRQLVLFLKNSDRLAKFRESQPDGTDLVVFLSKLEIDASEGQSDLAWRARSFYNAMNEACVKEGMLFRQNLDSDMVGYDPTAEQLDRQDSDDRYDQKTGTVTTGFKRKAVVNVQLVIEAQAEARNGRTEYAYVLRVRVFDGKTATDLASESFTITK
jgi:hypothetical protein